MLFLLLLLFVYFMLLQLLLGIALLIIPGVNFINVLRVAFARAEPESVKKDRQVVKSFYAFGICVRKSWA